MSANHKHKEVMAVSAKEIALKSLVAEVKCEDLLIKFTNLTVLSS